jgi:hypothetical protein
MMLSGSMEWVIGDLQRGQFMVPVPDREYNLGEMSALKRSAPHTLAGEIFGGDPRRRLILLKAAWPAAVGPELARRSEVVALDREVLRIRVPDGIWRRSLWRMRGDLLARLRSLAGRAAPRSLSIAEGGSSWPSPPPPRVASPSATTKATLPPDLARAAAAIPDEEIRRRFQDAAARYLARFEERDQTEGSGGDDSTD